jgi:hypothetical protein
MIIIVAIVVPYFLSFAPAAVSNHHWQRHLAHIGPTTAGLDIQATVGVRCHSPPGRASACSHYGRRER